MSDVTVISDAITLTPSLGEAGQRNPKVAYDGIDCYLVVWEEGADVEGYSVKQIYADRVMNIDGTITSMNTSGIHLLTSTYSQQLPKVSAGIHPTTGESVFLVVWQEFNGTDWDIKGMRVNSAGTLLDSGGLTICSQSHNQVTPDVCWDATNSRWFVVWSDFRNYSSGTSYQIYGNQVSITAVTASAVNPANEKLMVDYISHYAYGPYTMLMETPIVGTNGSKLLLGVSERHRTVQASDIISYLFSLDGTSGTEVMTPNLYGTKYSEGYPVSNGYSTQTGILTDGTDFLWMFRPISRAHLGMTHDGYLSQCFMVTSTGTIPATRQTDIDPCYYAICSSGCWADPYYWIVYESLPSVVTSYNGLAIGPVVHNLYAGRVSKDGLTALDYASPIPISTSSTASALNPAVAKGNGPDALVVYEEDNNLDYPSQTWQIKARLITVSTLAQDGPSTPEQLSLFLPSNLAYTATATMRYRPVAGAWVTGHDLYRIRPSFSEGSAKEGFAWVIMDLTPGTSYDVEVTTHDGDADVIYTTRMSTRALPAAAGAVTKNITDGMTVAQMNAVLATTVPGDVVQIADGTYDITGALTIPNSGNNSQPIYIRGQSRAGTIVHRVVTTSSPVVYFDRCSNVILENLTIQGTGVDNGGSPISAGISCGRGTAPVPVRRNITVRNVTMTGVDIIFHTGSDPLTGVLIYNNIFTGNNDWEQDFYAEGESGAPGDGDGEPDLNQGIFYNDDGMRLSGQGIAAFQNTIRGFGDGCTLLHGGPQRATHFYRNDITMNGDDGFEADYGDRNLTFYDNRLHNTQTLVSCDPLHAGPLIVARNIAINCTRTGYKLNSGGSGMFIWNNTVVRTAHPYYGTTYNQCWYQTAQGGTVHLQAWAFQNNILIYRGADLSEDIFLYFEPYVEYIDWSNNAWYPAGALKWTWSGGTYDDLADAQANLPDRLPQFGENPSRRMAGDIICESDPFITDIPMSDTDPYTEIEIYYTPSLSNGSGPRNAGIDIVGITDGHDGAAPDMGAIITGRSVPAWGDQS